ncbi:MAG: hypothetical protein KC422_25300, partial [Trueperaceae bacterium]|nr:hypothetical protein [Trueperaceae bacterium]
ALLRVYAAEELHICSGVCREAMLKLTRGVDPLSPKFEHEQIEEKYRPVSCKKRGVCPICGIAYGESKGLDLYKLIMATLAKRSHWKKGDPATFHFVATMPKEISEWLGDLVDKDLRENKYISQLQQAFRDILATRVFKTHHSKIMAAVNWHYTSSSKPLDGYHIHSHWIIPNVNAGGGLLRSKAVISEAILAEVRAAWFEALCSIFQDEMMHFVIRMRSQGLFDVSNRVNVEHHFLLNDETLDRKLRHHCAYDARHPYQDLLEFAQKCEAEGWQFWNRARDLALFFSRVAKLQGKKTRRYTGDLAPGRRRKAGFDQMPKEENTWQVEQYTSYQITRYEAPKYVELRKFSFGWRYTGSKFGVSDEGVVKIPYAKTRFFDSSVLTRWFYPARPISSCKELLPNATG